MAPYPQSITSFGSSEAQKSYNEEENCQEYRESRSIGKSASAESSSVICCFFQSIKSLLCFGLVVAVIVVISVVLAAVFSGQSVSDLQDLFIPLDPPGANEAERWNTRDQGFLRLEIINAMEESYTLLFDRYVQEWDNGTPDVLHLSSSRSTRDIECSPLIGVMNVCNGDYGGTQWKGLNTLTLRSGFIESSTAKMNDYYLASENEASKAYTVCHEIGHGFGLPHTDENYYNADRGDCMDYTVCPRNNLDPGTFNFQVLDELYGPPDINETEQILDNNPLPPRPIYEEERKNEEDRRLMSSLPDEVLVEYWKIMSEIEKISCQESSQGVRMLRQAAHFEECEADLGHGYVVQVHKLLVV